MKQKYWPLLGIIVIIFGIGLTKPGALGWTHVQAQTVPTAAPTSKPGTQPTVPPAQPQQPRALVPSPTSTSTAAAASVTSTAAPENTATPTLAHAEPLLSNTPAETAAPTSIPTSTPGASADSLICGGLIAGIVGMGVWGAVLNSRRQKVKKPVK